MTHVDAGDQARCQYCDKVFLNEGYLQKHVLRQHPNAVECVQVPQEAPGVTASMPPIPESLEACPAATPAPMQSAKPADPKTEPVEPTAPAPVWRSYSTLAQAYTKRGKYFEALECYCKALAELRELFGDQDANVASLYQSMGGVFYKQGKHATAVDYFGKALRILQSVPGIPSGSVWRTYMNMATAYAAQLRCTDALSCLSKALEASSPEQKSEKLRTLRSIAEVHKLGKNYPEALASFQQLLTAQQQVYGPSHAEVGRTYVSIARVFDALGEREEALQRYRKAMAIERTAPRESAKYSQLAMLFAASIRYGDALMQDSKGASSDVDSSTGARSTSAPSSSAGEASEEDVSTTASTTASSPLPSGRRAGFKGAWPHETSVGVEIMEV